MKKILSILIILAFLCAAGFMFFNTDRLLNLYYWFQWDRYYAQGNYEQALEYHQKMIDSEQKYFSMGNGYYRLDNYKDAALEFSKTQDYKWLYNTGNAFYRLWENKFDIAEKIDFWKWALIMYDRSLDVQETQRARENYDFVQSQLDELLEQQEQDKSEEETQEQEEQSNNQDWTNQDEWETTEENQETQWQEDDQESNQLESEQGQDSGSENSDDIIPQPRWEQYQLWEESSIWDMTPAEQAAIEAYIDQLKNEQEQNQRFFNKQTDESFSRDWFESFMNPFRSFDDIQSSGEKDW